MSKNRISILAVLITLMSWATGSAAADGVEVVRRDDASVTVRWADSDPVDIFISDRPEAVVGETPVVRASRSGEEVIALPVAQRRYVVIRDSGDGSLIVAGERLLALQQGSNFRDIGGYVGADGKRVRWGRIYRSGALPMLTERDNALVEGLGIESIIDFRSNEERSVAPTTLDDRTGALFISNDYSINNLMRDYAANGPGENMYVGLTQMVRPQYRAMFNRLLAGEGATMVHCSAGQDRTGVATALVLSALGVDRATIIADYHKSTEWRRPQWEMPADLNPADHPGNLIVQYYAASRARPGGPVAEPLYTRSGQSHLVQFFAHIDSNYGGVEGYLDRELGVTAADIARLKTLYLE